MMNEVPADVVRDFARMMSGNMNVALDQELLS